MNHLKTAQFNFEHTGMAIDMTLIELAQAGHPVVAGSVRSRMDRRSVRVKLTDKGQAIADIVGKLYNRHIISIETVGGINRDDFKVLNKSLQRLERFWTDQILYRL